MRCGNVPGMKTVGTRNRMVVAELRVTVPDILHQRLAVDGELERHAHVVVDDGRLGKVAPAMDTDRQDDATTEAEG